MTPDGAGPARLLAWQRRQTPLNPLRAARQALTSALARRAPPVDTQLAQPGGIEVHQCPGGWTARDPELLARTLRYTCNLCSTANQSLASALERESPSCVRCGSTVRQRSIIDLLSRALFDRSLPIAQFPQAGKCGIGISDAPAYASRLPTRLAYANTYFHQAPRLDLCAPDPALQGCCDFVIASDVLEHVVPPVGRAFAGAWALLRDGGAFIGSVPYSVDDAPADEHFPHLHEFRIEGSGQQRTLHNRRRDGSEETFDNLVFHGGDGATLEMRLFTRAALAAELSAAGFSRITFAEQDVLPWGIAWNGPWSIPFVAFKGVAP